MPGIPVYVVIELLIIGILNDWPIISATRGKHAASSTIIESSIIEKIAGIKIRLLQHSRPSKGQEISHYE